MRRLHFKHPNTTPGVRGLYVRDWRGTKIEPAHERTLCVDAWEPVADPKDILFPGVWYVFPGINDASEQRLPWREAADDEIRACLWRYPDAHRWLEERESA